MKRIATREESQELVSSAPDSRNWRGIVIALFVIVAVCALIVTAVILLTPGDQGPRVKNPRISLSEVLSGAFQPRRFNGSWISEKEFVFRDNDGALILYNAENKAKITLMNNTTFRQYDVQMYYISPDRQFVLLVHDIEMVFRHSFTAKYKIYDLDKKEIFPLKHTSNHERLQYVNWGKAGNQLVYVFDNNIFFIPNLGDSPVQLVSTGVKDVIYNGIPDWVYEEEVLSSNNAIWWSPNGSKLCYASFNDSEVDIMSYSYYGSEDPSNSYPELRQLRYPKAGRTNPTVTLHVVNLENPRNQAIQVKPPDYFKNKDFYITFVGWEDENNLFVNFLNRLQNYSIVARCSASSSWQCQQHIVESCNTGWVELNDAPLFSSDLTNYFLKLPIQDGHHGKFRHVASIEISTKKTYFLTHGAYDITQILAYHSERKLVYYLSTQEKKPGVQHLYYVPDSKNETAATCLTCDNGDECLYNNAIFSPGAKYYILECLGPDIPRVSLKRTEDNAEVDVLETNDALSELYNDRALPQIRTFLAPLTDGYNATVRLLLPPGLKDEEIIKYPLVLNVYGGPGTQIVNEKFKVDWGYYLASKKNIIYAAIDGRGSGNQGDKRLHELYKRLGTVEVEDQLKVASYLKGELPFIDENHCAIWGWSYGGYVSAMALATSKEVFSCGISVAPVTNWLYYDTIYTERYMQLPTDNTRGYEQGDVLRKAADLKGKKYYLVHGTADDNVHVQQSMMLMKALTRAGITFRTQVYPDENHALNHVTNHLYKSLENFLDYCFDVKPNHENAVQSS